jgi:uncharacterized protein (TIGR02996 family)
MSTTSLEQAFLDSIVASPDDPTTWLVLADWLEDHDDPRAELVRLTWSLTHESHHREFRTRQSRLQGLLAAGVQPVVPQLALAGDFEFAWIPPGSFLIGSPVREISRDPDETRHEVTLTHGFWLGIYPVTQDQWRTVMGNNPSAFSRSGEDAQAVASLSDDEVDRLPVENVSWDDLPAFFAALGARLGRVVRLPTEAEWEYACRAGTTTPFHFGDVLNGEQANVDGKYPYGMARKGPSRERTTVVGSFPPNPWGLYDMHGNVGEWVRDSFRLDFENLPPTDPVQDVPDAPRRIFRGGAWDHRPIHCRCAYRNHVGPVARDNNVGFRVVLE